MPTLAAKNALSDEQVQALAMRLLAAKKYRALELPAETITDLLEANRVHAKNLAELEKVARQKLHNIVAPYLEAVDYPAAAQALHALAPGDEAGLRQFSQGMLQHHASTRERLPILEAFYAAIFGVTGVPGSLLDLACGFGPFALPWMHLPPATSYHAYDLHQPRVNLLNDYLEKLGRPRLAEKRDILVNPSAQRADVAFFFKEAHRFEQRQHGCNRSFWEALNVKYLVVSLPTANLSGSHSMLEGQRILVQRNIGTYPWKVQEIVLESEIIFCIDKEA